MLKRYIKRDVKMPCRSVSLHRGPIGELEVIGLPGIYERKG
jgi:hypothetical protein